MEISLIQTLHFKNDIKSSVASQIKQGLEYFTYFSGCFLNFKRQFFSTPLFSKKSVTNLKSFWAFKFALFSLHFIIYWPKRTLSCVWRLRNSGHWLNFAHLIQLPVSLVFKITAIFAVMPAKVTKLRASFSLCRML